MRSFILAFFLSTFVMLLLSFSPMEVAFSLSFVFYWLSPSMCDSRLISSAYSRSSSTVVMVHCNHCHFPSVMLSIIQLIVRKNYRMERIQPCLTPVFTFNGSVTSLSWMTPHSKYIKKRDTVVFTRYDGRPSQNNKHPIQCTCPFVGLFHDLAMCENIIYAWSFFPKASLFMP